MIKGKKILVVGSMNMDLIVTTNRFPADGETVSGLSSVPHREAKAQLRLYRRQSLALR